jgi:hypothetical protein
MRKNAQKRQISQPIERLGEVSKNKHGSLMTIIKYNNATDIEVYFENGFTTNCTYNQFKCSNLSSPLDKTCYGIGYFGEGKYSKHKSYDIWRGMFTRCYDEKYLAKYTTYIGCTVCEEWHNYQNFAKWYDENYYIILGKNMELDKDILIKGNKIYSPETCVFVPQDVNYLFTKTNKLRGKYPIGVSLTRDNKFATSCNDGNKELKYLGRYNTPEEAFEVYKKYKEKIIKQIAEEYKNKIPSKLYNAMYRYEVEITD